MSDSKFTPKSTPVTVPSTAKTSLAIQAQNLLQSWMGRIARETTELEEKNDPASADTLSKFLTLEKEFHEKFFSNISVATDKEAAIKLIQGISLLQQHLKKEDNIIIDCINDVRELRRSNPKSFTEGFNAITDESLKKSPQYALLTAGEMKSTAAIKSIIASSPLPKTKTPIYKNQFEIEAKKLITKILGQTVGVVSNLLNDEEKNRKTIEKMELINNALKNRPDVFESDRDIANYLLTQIGLLSDYCKQNKGAAEVSDVIKSIKEFKTFHDKNSGQFVIVHSKYKEIMDVATNPTKYTQKPQLATAQNTAASTTPISTITPTKRS